MRHAFLIALLLAGASLPAPGTARAQDGSDERWAVSSRFGYLIPQDGLTATVGIEYQTFLGRQHTIPSIALDMIVSLDQDDAYYRDQAGYCRSAADDAFVGEALCAPDISFAFRGEVQFRLGSTSIFAGPGLRVPGTGDPGETEPFAFVIFGEDVFLRASAGRGFQQFEIGFLF